MQLTNVFLLPLLCPLAFAADTCREAGNCQVDDETSLVQVKSVLKPGSEREEDLEEEDVKNKEVIQDYLADADKDSKDNKWNPWARRRGTTGGGPYGILSTPTQNTVAAAFVMPAKCSGSTYCIGTAPFCGGEKNDCATRSMKVVGWTKKCSGHGALSTCLSGWKVRCATCESTVIDLPYPAAASVVAQWVAPVFDRRRAAVAPTPAPPLAIPPFGLASYSYSYNATALAAAKAAMKAAMANIVTFKATVCNITNQIEGIGKNITYFTEKERRAREAAVKSRGAAVRFAKKRTLANITVMKAKMALDDAYMAQHGAANRAIRVSARSGNARRKKVFYEKMLIDKQESLKRAEASLRVGKIALQKANHNTVNAKKMLNRHRRMEKYVNGKGKKRYIAHRNVKTAQNLAMKKAMEQAYAMASPLFGVQQDQARNETNVPVWGKGFGSVTFSASTPPCRCLGKSHCGCQ